MNNVPFDSKHTFHLNHFLDVEKYAEMDPTYVEPETEVYKPGVRDWMWPRRSPSDPILGTSARLVGRRSGKGPICHLSRRRGNSKLARKALPMRGRPHQDCTSRIPVERSLPSFLVELDEPICLVVATRHVSRHLTPARCLLMGWHFLGNETAVRPSTGQTHRLLSER